MASLIIELLESGKLELLGGMLTQFALVFIPFLIIVNHVKDWRIMLLCVLIFCGVIFGAIYQAFPDEPKAETPSDLVIGDETVVDFYDILREVGIASSKAKNIKKIEDWAQGPRYSFETHGTTAIVYCNMDYEIQTIRVGGDTALYERGYEPWKIDNFIVSADMRSELITYTEKVVKQCLNYPATADFPLLDWSVGREFNRYAVSSHVEAKNAFGVPSEIPFKAGYWVEDGTIKLIYLNIDGSVVVNEVEEYPLPERKKVDIETEPMAEGEARIVDGQLGEYGKTVQLDSYEYIWYMVPAGTYKAACNSKYCRVYVDKNEITRNSDGYVEMETVATYTWNHGEHVIITVKEDEHLFNVKGSDYTLTKVN